MGIKCTARYALIGAVLLGLQPAAGAVAAERQVRVVLDGEVRTFDAPAFLEDGTFYLPVRGVLEQLGFVLDWDAVAGRLTAAKDGLRRLELTPDRTEAVLPSGTVDLEKSVRLKDGTAYMPAAPVMKLLGYDVETDAFRGSFYVKTPVWLRIGEAVAAGGGKVRLEGNPSGFGAVADDVKLYLEEELVYEGAFRNGALTGGKVYDQGRLVYEGGLASNKPDGTGVLYQGGTGSRYEGQFRDGAPHGKGRWFSGGRLIYDGDWKAGRMEGNGKQYGADGKIVYQGMLVNGVRQGYGLAYNTSGGVLYEGNWAHGVRSGFGKEFGSDGKLVYSGIWKEDRRNGGGTLNRYGKVKFYEADGTKVSSVKELDALYVRDVEYANGIIIEQNAKEWIYTGSFTAAGEPNGEGEVGLVTGTNVTEAGVLTSWSPHYKGTLQYGAMTGAGVFFDSAGRVSYEGEVHDGKRNGQGSSYVDGAIVYSGEWRDDVPHGAGWEYKVSPSGGTGSAVSDTTITRVRYANGKLAGTGDVYRVSRNGTGTGLTGTGIQIWIYDAGRGGPPPLRFLPAADRRRPAGLFGRAEERVAGRARNRIYGGGLQVYRFFQG